MSGVLFAQSPPVSLTVTGYGVSSQYNSLDHITAGPDGALRFLDCLPNGGACGTVAVGRSTTAEAITEYPVSWAHGIPSGITTGPDGALWFTTCTTPYPFTTCAGKIGRITIAGAVTECFISKTSDSAPNAITAGPDGALWFTDGETSSIGRITTAGAVTEYYSSVGARDGIAAGSDGALWFTGWVDDVAYIGRITTAGTITQYTIPGENFPDQITAGPDGALWFAYDTSIGRITTSGAITVYPIPSGDNAEFITTGPDGALWFTECCNYFGIGRISTSGLIAEYPVAGTGAIVTGPDGALWVTGETVTVPILIGGFSIMQIGFTYDSLITCVPLAGPSQVGTPYSTGARHNCG